MTCSDEARDAQEGPKTEPGGATRELRFDGRVTIVTGAGRGIGRAYAHLLAARGATVVVNDLGGSVEGTGADASPADAVVAEITDTGGTATADHHDVSTEAGAAALVEGAIERHGRVDALVNNAGIMRWAGFPDVTADDLHQHLAVHLGGSFHTARAAWPHMANAGYGRIVVTTSAGMFGHTHNVAYATAKAAVVGLANSIRLAGEPVGIKVNVIAPAAFTRMAGGTADAPEAGTMAPELVAPMVAVLAHETCPVNGEIYAAGAGRFARIAVATTDGYLHADGTPSPEDVAARWDEIHELRDPWIPTDLMDWSAGFTRHLERD